MEVALETHSPQIKTRSENGGQDSKRIIFVIFQGVAVAAKFIMLTYEDETRRDT